MHFMLTAARITQINVPIMPERAGGIVTFEGRVRAWNEGKRVTRLDYEAYETLALSVGEAILADATQRFGLLAVHALHRTGTLGVGEVAVWIYAAAPHRGPAFLAAEYIIAAIKQRVPIWKKEWYDGEAPKWVRCHHAA